MQTNVTEDQLVEQLTGPIIKAFHRSKQASKRFNSQNRDSWKRMNRPEKDLIIERGANKIYALIARFKP
jgi:hypothetical protein